MSGVKRGFDIVLALVLMVLSLPVLAVLLPMLWVIDGGAVFYVSERMKTPAQGFQLIKLRTMSPIKGPTNSGVSGGDKAARITRLGAFLRRTRLDEIPQLWNILRGDMSFVGPRPPLRQYVEMFPELYDNILKNRPGITGLATLILHAHEERILAACTSPAETEAAYVRRCIPRKARLDMIYQKNCTLWFDLWLIGQTARALWPGSSQKGS